MFIGIKKRLYGKILVLHLHWTVQVEPVSVYETFSNGKSNDRDPPEVSYETCRQTTHRDKKDDEESSTPEIFFYVLVLVEIAVNQSPSVLTPAI